jgi:GNAT superfamily N-acetyltransferase
MDDVDATFDLRAARPSDLDWIVELRAEVLRDDLTRLGRFDPVRVRERFRTGFSPEHLRVIVVDGADVGCIAVRADGEVQWIEHFFIRPDAQGRGLGGAVLGAVLAQHRGGLPFRLDVLRGSAARRLYERHGFVVDDDSDPIDVYLSRPADPPRP